MFYNGNLAERAAELRDKERHGGIPVDSAEVSQ